MTRCTTIGLWLAGQSRRDGASAWLTVASTGVVFVQRRVQFPERVAVDRQRPAALTVEAEQGGVTKGIS